MEISIKIRIVDAKPIYIKKQILLVVVFAFVYLFKQPFGLL
jgi:hypothetical protein